jgi:sugar/nucleoside kinase (ribokinase family)
MARAYDIAFVGNYTKDTIISKKGTRLVHGGACNYGSNVAVRLGLNVAVITRLAKADRAVVESLENAGIDVFPTYTERSTCLTLEYPTDDPDKRLMYVTGSAGTFTPDQVRDIDAKAFVLGPSFHGEIQLDVLNALRAKDTIIACDVQGYVRADGNGNAEYVNWDKAEMQEVLARVDILKTDAVEADLITGESDKKQAAAILSTYGPREIVLTHREGLIVYADKTYYEANFTPKELIGRSGRGDTCIGTYTSKRLSAPPETAYIWAAAATSLKMEAEGPFKGTLNEIEAKIRSDYGSVTSG